RPLARRGGTMSPERMDPERSSRPPSRAATLFMPQRARPRSHGSSPSLPADLREQATGRLGVIALTYAAVFFFADFFPAFVSHGFTHVFRDASDWLPGTISIVGALLFAVFAPSPRLSWETKVNLGLVFEVLASWGIAMAQYGATPAKDVPPMVYHVLSPSW